MTPPAMAPLASAPPTRRGRAGRGAHAGRRLRALALGLAALGPSAPAFAQPPQAPPAAPAGGGGQSDSVFAEALFRQGRTLMSQNRVTEACAKFADSQKLDPKLGTLLNLAVCYEKEGKTASAWAKFVEATSQASRSGQAERSRFARTKAQELEKKLVRVEFRVESPAAEQTLSLGPRSIPSSAWGVPIPVDPGTYAVTASAPHKKEWSGELVVPEKSAAAVPFAVPPLAAEAPAPAPAPAPAATAPEAAPEAAPQGGDWRRPAAYVAGSVAVAGLALGAVFGLRTLSKESRADKECDGRFCSAEGLSLHDDARQAATVSTVGFAVGAIGLGLGTYFLLSSGGQPASAPPKAGALGWSPRFGRQGAGLQLEGTW